MIPQKIMEVIERHQYLPVFHHNIAHRILEEAQLAAPGPYTIEVDLYTGKVNIDFKFTSNDEYVMWVLKYS